MTQQCSENYAGHRILDAMHNAVLYSETVFGEVLRAIPGSSARILDFGAGDGLFVQKFHVRGVSVDCVEPDENLRMRLEDDGVTVSSGTRTIADASYDFIYTINVLEHIPELNAACSELFRIMKPGGRLFVFVPAFEVLWTSLDDEVGHVQRFTRASILRVLQSAGFNVERIQYFDSLGFPAALTVRFLEKFNLFQYDRGTVGLYDRCVFPVSRRLDGVFHHLLGKNLVALARKDLVSIRAQQGIF